MHWFFHYSQRNHTKNIFIKDIGTFYLKKKEDFIYTVVHKKLNMKILFLEQFRMDQADHKLSIIIVNKWK